MPRKKPREFYHIKSIFGPTIQGEGSHVGRKVLFIRFSGCNRWTGLPKDKASSICSFCDTKFYGGRKMKKEEILEELERLNGPHRPRLPVVLSGGEPALQIDEPLLLEIKCLFREVHIETNGSLPLTRMSYFNHITMSPKQPLEETKLRYCHDLKILYPFINDDITVEKFLPYSALKIYISPIEEDGFYSEISRLNRRLAVDYLMKTYIPEREIRYSGQIHKLLEVK